MSNEHANNPSLIIHNSFSSTLSHCLNLKIFHYSLTCSLLSLIVCFERSKSYFNFGVCVHVCVCVCVCVAGVSLCAVTLQNQQQLKTHKCCLCSEGHCDYIQEILFTVRVCTSGQGLLITTSLCVHRYKMCAAFNRSESLLQVPCFL